MKPPEDIKRYFQKATLSTNPEKHEAVFEKIASAHEQSNKKEPDISRISLGRIIMKSPISKIAAAAIVIFACVIGLNIFGPSSIALGDVLAQIEKFSAYVYEMSMNAQATQTVGDSTVETNQDIYGTILLSQGHGMKMTMDVFDKNTGQNIGQEMYFLFEEKSLFILLPAQKSYTRMEIDDTLIEKAKAQNYDPRSMIEQILACEYEILEQKTINGIKVQGFHTNDPKYDGGMLGQVDVTLWVDVKTQLPVQMILESEINSSVQTISMSGIIDNFQWKVSIDDEEFQPVIPQDYTSALGDSVKMPDIYDEETVIEGLRIYADLMGKYPEDLNPMSLPSEISQLVRGDTPAAKKFQEESKELSNDERTQKLIDISLKVQGAGLFYTMLGQEDKDPAYYGDIVSPGDSDNVLVRWKVSDNDYRVIFGDLKIETLTAETLIMLENMLPEEVPEIN